MILFPALSSARADQPRPEPEGLQREVRHLEPGHHHGEPFKPYPSKSQWTPVPAPFTTWGPRRPHGNNPRELCDAPRSTVFDRRWNHVCYANAEREIETRRWLTESY